MTRKLHSMKNPLYCQMLPKLTRVSTKTLGGEGSLEGCGVRTRVRRLSALSRLEPAGTAVEVSPDKQFAAILSLAVGTTIFGRRLQGVGDIIASVVHVVHWVSASRRRWDIMQNGSLGTRVRQLVALGRLEPAGTTVEVSPDVQVATRGRLAVSAAVVRRGAGCAGKVIALVVNIRFGLTTSGCGWGWNIMQNSSLGTRTRQFVALGRLEPAGTAVKVTPDVQVATSGGLTVGTAVVRRGAGRAGKVIALEVNVRFGLGTSGQVRVGANSRLGTRHMQLFTLAVLEPASTAVVVSPDKQLAARGRLAVATTVVRGCTGSGGQVKTRIVDIVLDGIAVTRRGYVWGGSRSSGRGNSWGSSRGSSSGRGRSCSEG
ncbi:hypothetical protein Ae201684_009071 [Aphanomyces euteiches]|uniref:Uncharacterized protein n=1 Tax=Aphanomyces euteiches TaxID=100861 RepID=A0A6G0X2Z1_9STRA|nr:hypothetical protein Ae201684_009071 [Aphanomyces euteiches]